jgi:hypothetical protein
MAQKTVPGGTILRGDDGSWYYIRDDQLGPFRVADKETLDAFRKLEAREKSDVGGFAAGWALVDGGPVTIFAPSTRLGSFQVNRAVRGIGIGAC